MKYALAGDREINCNVLKFLMEKGFKPELLFITNKLTSSHADKLITISKLEEDKIIEGKDFLLEKNIERVKELELDYIFGIHFPYIIPSKLIQSVRVGFLNLHPSFLPYNKGWHTPTWAILDKTTYGATLHFMTESLDAGDIIHQKEIKVKTEDTANSLYKRVLKLELEVFIEAFPQLLTLAPLRKEQLEKGTVYQKKDLSSIQEFSLDENVNTGDFINKLRALTTNKTSEAAYFIRDNEKYSVQLKIEKIK